MTSSWSPNRQPIPAAWKKAIRHRDGNTCQLCGGVACGNQGLVFDHRVPLSEGGPHTKANLQLVGAVPCHKAKSEAERRRGLARKSVRRPSEHHPGLR